MSPAIVEKARANRSAALEYLDRQKRILVRITDFRLKGPARRPVPAVGFASSRGLRGGAEAA